MQLEHDKFREAADERAAAAAREAVVVGAQLREAEQAVLAATAAQHAAEEAGQQQINKLMGEIALLKVGSDIPPKLLVVFHRCLACWLCFITLKLFLNIAMQYVDREWINQHC